MPARRPQRSGERSTRGRWLTLLTLWYTLVTSYTLAQPQLVGLTVTFDTGTPLDAVVEQFDRLAELGTNAVLLHVPLPQPNANSPTLADHHGRRGTPPPDEIVDAARAARQRGLRVVLVPTITFTAPQRGDAVERLRPAHWGNWWDRYDAAMAPLIDAAARGDVDTLALGDRLMTTLSPAHRPRWNALVRRARDRFPGRLTFLAPADAADAVPFWDALDLLGLTEPTPQAAGPGAGDPTSPTRDQRTQRWAHTRAAALADARRHGKPILLANVGFASDPNTRDQTDGYRALLDAWSRVIGRPAGAGDSNVVAGVLFDGFSPANTGGPFDLTRTVRAKPAEAYLRRWLAGE